MVRDHTALLAYLDDDRARFNKNAALGTQVFVTYSFMSADDLPDLADYDPYEADEYWTFNAAQRANMRLAMAELSSKSGVTFVEVASNEGLINIFGSSGTAYGGWSHYPFVLDGYASPGKLVIDGTGNFERGTANWHVMLHELGHAVGLGHPFEGDVTLHPSLDSTSHTIMSYNWSGGYRTTYGRLDIAALQAIYGSARANTGWTWAVEDGVFVLTAGADADVLIGVNLPNNIQGKGGHDRLIGMIGYDTLDGGAGNDTLEGGRGNDILRGAEGRDQLFGGGDDDRLFGGAGADSLVGGIGDDLLEGGAGNDTLIGDGDDGTTTFWGNDTLRGGDGDDRLEGGLYADRLFGGAGRDRLYGGSAEDLLDGGAGDDTLHGDEGSDTLRGGDGNDLIYGGDYGHKLIYGGTGADTVHAGLDGSLWGVGADTVHGGTGNDLILGYDGQDSLLGEAGNDTLYGGNGSDNLYGGAGADRLFGDAGNDTLYGGAGADRLYGGQDHGSLYGGAGNDTIVGGESYDRISGGAGADLLTGGGGGDSFYFAATDRGALDRITDFEVGLDRILITGGVYRLSDMRIQSEGPGGANTLITIGNQDIRILLTGVDIDDFITTSVGFYL